MKIHIIGVPRNPSTPKISMDPYAMVSYYLTTYLHRKGYDVDYYGYEQSTVECNNKWICADEKHHKKYCVTNPAEQWEQNHEGERIYNSNALNHLLKNLKDNEIVICMWSVATPYVANAVNNKFEKHDIKIVDGHIGHRHPSPTTAFHVFASYANKHFVYGSMPEGTFSYWHDAVIYPMANDLNNFTYKSKKEDYFLFMGRLNEDKGIGIFFDLAKHFKDKQFILAGQGKHNKQPLPNVKEIGVLDPIQRKKYLANAKAVISPSHYAEPFGLTAVEAGLSGTPIICTDHGGYTESVIHNVTGFRCSYFSDFVNAINNIENISPASCRKNAERFSAEELIKDWEIYLKRINRLGWYALEENK